MVREVLHRNASSRPSRSSRCKGLLLELSPFNRVGEQLRFLRLCMVLVSFAPLFLLMAIRGNSVLSDTWTWLGCSLFIAFPLSFLMLRIFFVWRADANDEIIVGSAEDSRSHVLGYLFATMLPFYRSSIDQWRDLLALAVALAFILLVFWCLRWHYVNWLLLVLGYHVYTVIPPEDTGHLGRRTPLVVITRRARPVVGERFYAKRVSDTVYWETGV